MECTKGIASTFFSQAELHPDRRAVSDERGSFTYRELQDRAVLTASQLHRMQLSAGTAVGVLLPRVRQIASAAFGIFTEGLAYMPMSDAYPPERIRYMLSDSNAGALITVRGLLKEKALDFPEDRVIFLDEIDGTGPAECVPVDDPELRAMILYTSGTTGRPKGVVYRQRELLNAMTAFASCEATMSDKSRTAEFAEITFIASIPFLFGPLLLGGETHIISNELRTDLAGFYAYLRQHDINNVFLPPSVGVMMLESYDMRGIDVILAGEKLRPFRSLFPCSVFNDYGSSEGINVSLGRVDGTETEISVGRPPKGVTLFIVDDEGNTVEKGETGEAVYHSDYMAWEYLNNPELTCEKWFEKDGLRFFRTGDRMHEGADGKLYLSGRTDDMFKYHGFRVEPGEIENKARESVFGPELREVVCVLKNIGGAETICLYYEGDREIPGEKLRNELKKTLPDYMVPERVIRMERLPRNANGKIQRRELPLPESDSDEVCLTSLEAMRFIAEARERYGAELDYRDVLGVHSRAALDAMVKAAAGKVKEETFAREPVEKAPLAPSQEGVWTDARINSDSVSYNLPFAIYLPGSIGVETLQKALNDILFAHPVLNTVFSLEQDGTAVQRRREADAKEQVWPLTEVSAETLEQKKNDFVRPFDLLSGEPLYRFEICRLPDGSLCLLCDFHHLIFDGFTCGLFRRELETLLNGGTIAPESCDMLQFATRQKAFEGTAEWNAMREYWRGRISLVDEMTGLLPDQYGHSSGGGEEKTAVFRMDASTLSRYAMDCGIQRNALYLGACIYAVSVFTGEKKIGVVTVSSGRQHAEVAGSYGMFVNTLPFIENISGGSVTDYLRMIQKDLSDAVANDGYPFARIAAEYKLSPLIMIACQESLFGEETAFAFENLERGTAKFPVYIEVNGDHGQVEFRVRYDSLLFSAKFMQSLADTIGLIAQQMTVCARLEDVRLTDAKTAERLENFNAHEFEIEPGEGTVVSMFRAAAEKYPDHLAVQYQDRKYTYSEIDRMTEKMAARIRALAQGNIVAIMIPRSEYMVIVSLAVLKTGLAYQPIDPSYPKERIGYMLGDSGAKLLITTQELSPLTADLDLQIVTPEALRQEVAGEAEEKASALCAPAPGDLFTILYTSGSTGTPKGVLLEHGNLAVFCQWYRRHYGLTPEDRVAAYASYGFDANMMDMYPALTCGAGVCIIPEEKRLDMDWIEDYFNQSGVTHVFMTTQIGVRFALEHHPKSLRYLAAGGEKMPALEPPTGFIMENAYGPTECTIFTTVKRIEEREENIPIGRPLSGVKCYVMDEHLRMLPIGASGELVIAGPQVTRGYLNLPDKTAERYFTLGDSRAYHSGDIVRYRQDGDIEFVGRRDGLVKIRGFRIELGEVEGVIRSCPGIRDAVVQAFDRPGGGKFLAAYVVCEGPLQTDKLKQFFLSQKPAYMLPSVFMKIDKIPLNVNQKVDRKALPKPEFQAGGDYTAPENEMEKLLVETLGELLGIQEPISVSASFSDVGGDSISSIRFNGMLRDKGVDLSIQHILRCSSIREMASVAEQCTEKTEISQARLPGFIDNTPIVNYFFDLDFVNPAYFSQIFAFKVAGHVDEDKLKRAMQAVILHHDMLCAIVSDRRLYVRDLDEDDDTRSLFSLEMLGDGSTVDSVEVTERLARSLDIENGPMIRAAVLRRDGKEYLVIAIHHLLVDGISWRVIEEELNIAYMQLQEGKDISLPEKTNSYRDYALALEQFASARALTRQREYWDEVRNKMGSYAMSMPDRSARVFTKTRVQLDKAHTESLLRDCGKAYHTGINDLLIAAVGMACHALTGERGLNLRLEGHGREEFGANLVLDHTVGWFTSIYPVVIEGLDGDIRSIIRGTKETLSHIPSKGFGYPILYGIETEQLPLVTFNYLGELGTEEGRMFTQTSALPVADFIAPENHYGTDLNINGMTADQSMTFLIEMNSSRYSQQEIEKFTEAFEGALEEIISHTLSVKEPEMTASDFGEMVWSDSEFLQVCAFYQARGEQVLAIEPLRRDQEQRLQAYMLHFDSRTCIRKAVFDLDFSLSSETLLDALNETYEECPILRKNIAWNGNGEYRLVTTDRKATLYDVDELPWMSPIISGDQVRIGLYRESDKSYILVCANMVFVDNGDIRTCIKTLFKKLANKLENPVSLSQWLEILEVRDAVQMEKEERLRTQAAAESKEMRARDEQPYSKTEKDLAAVYAYLLGVPGETIGLMSDFCQLAGDDYMVHLLAEMIYMIFHKQIRLVEIKKNSVLMDLARVIDGRNTEGNGFEPIHVYSEIPGKKTYYFVHTANTGSEAYYLLAKVLQDRCGFAVFENYNLYHSQQLLTSIEDIAEHYLEELRKKQPHGPYYLGGWCFGGMVAFEMAQQLKRAGETVEELILFDVHIIADEDLRSRVLRNAMLSNREYLSEAPLFAELRMKGMLDALIANSINHTRAWLYYEPKHYDGKVVYFRANEKRQGLNTVQSEMYDYVLNEKAAGFEKIVDEKNLTIIPVHAEHDSMMSQDALDEMNVTKYMG